MGGGFRRAGSRIKGRLQGQSCERLGASLIRACPVDCSLVSWRKARHFRHGREQLDSVLCFAGDQAEVRIDGIASAADAGPDAGALVRLLHDTVPEEPRFR